MQLWGGTFPHTLRGDKGSPLCSLPTPASPLAPLIPDIREAVGEVHGLVNHSQREPGGGAQGEPRACHDPLLSVSSTYPGSSLPLSQAQETSPQPLLQTWGPDPQSLLPRPGGPGPQPLLQTRGSRPPAPPPDAPPDSQPLLQTRGPDPTLPPSDTGVQTPSPSSRPGGPAPSPSSRCSSRPPAPPPDPGSRSHSSALRPGGPDSQSLLQTPGSSPLAPPPSDPGVQTRSPFPLRPGGLVPQPFLAQTQACLLPLTLTQSVPWWHSGWASACPCRGRRFHLWSQQIPPAAGDKTRGCATTPEPAATTEAQAPRADILQPEQPPQGRVPRSPAHRS